MKSCRTQSGCVALLRLAATLVCALLLASCGGGGGGSTTRPPAGLTITSTALSDGTAGQAYSRQLTASGGSPPYTWGLTSDSGPLPNGLTLSTSGTISGTPTTTGSFDFGVQVTDSATHTANRALNLKVNPGPLTITTDTLLNGIAGKPYAQVLTVVGGTPPYSWSLASGSGLLPPGLTLNTEGMLGGTFGAVSVSGQYFSFTVQVADAASQQATRGLTITVFLPLVIDQTSLPDGNVGEWYGGYVRASGGTYSYNFQWTLTTSSQPLPAGMSLETAGGWGSIYGIPTQSGSFLLEIQVLDPGPPQQIATSTIPLFIDNRLAVYPVDLPVGVVNQPYTASLQALGGAPPYSWRITIGDLPEGMSLSPSGVLSGTPLRDSWGVLWVEVTDSATPTATATGFGPLWIKLPISFNAGNPNDGVKGREYSGGVGLNGGRDPLTIRVISGTLPPGLSFGQAQDSGHYYPLAGTPTTTGTFAFTLEGADSFSPAVTTTADFEVRIADPLTLTTTALPQGWTGDSYDFTLAASGGIPPYIWSAGSLPPGLSLGSQTGKISGIPTEAFDGTFGFILDDSAHPQQSGYHYLPLKIIARLAIMTSRLPAARRDSPYRVNLGLFGGTAPYTWSIASGSLPSGLALNAATGEITGTPTTEGTFSFTVQVTDAGPPVQTTSKALSLTIKNDLGRNDTPATATPISNGTFRASLSPYSDPIDGPAEPDSDYYVLAANSGAVVTVETMAGRLVPASPVDSVIEIVDAAGNRFETCRPGWDTYGSFNQPCLSDDFDSYTSLDSKLYFQIPGTGTGPVTFYIHILDWSGNARPDFVYDLIVFGAN